MQVALDTQELARRFNEDEAVWRRYQQLRVRRRALRRRFGVRPRQPQDALDRLDWQAAERACRQTRCIGRLISLPSSQP